MNRELGKSRVLTKVEFGRVVKYQKSTKYGVRNIVLLHLSFFCGLRSKEMSLLKISDLVDSGGQFKKEVLLKRKMTKGSKQRRFYLTNDKLRKVISEYFDQRKKDGTYDLNRPVILSQKNGHFTPNTLQQLFRRMYDSVGLDGARSHSGRRTFATRCLESGVGIKNLQTLMGHSSINTTAIYAEENPVLLGKIVSNFNI